MLTGVIILFVGMVIGYFLRPVVLAEQNALSKVVKSITPHQRGIVVDLTPPVDLGEPINDVKN